jgi:xylulokinase
MWLGLDIGTSAVKAAILDEHGMLACEASAPLSVQRPRADRSEQDPEAWWQAANAAVAALPAHLRSGVRAIGLAGQMHGAVLLDRADRPLRPAILWNDGRSAAECAELELIEPNSRQITGNAAMPGFTAPKILWVRRHEPDVSAAVAKILLPKDYIRLRMTGDHATDLSDASGTLWLDVGRRRWSEAMLTACGLHAGQMPALHEGTSVTGSLRDEVAAAWGMDRVPVAAGAGDNAAGAIGCGVVNAGEAFLSLGTSGVIFVARSGHSPAPDKGAHSFCHALPGLWHQMAVMLSAASSLEWAARLGGYPNVGAALAGAAVVARPFSRPETFLPYLSGERTPHNDASARGALIGLSHDSGAPDIILAVLEGVALAFRDGLDVLVDAGATIDSMSVIGGGSRSGLWGKILAAALNRPLTYRRDAHTGPAFGAARLARISLTGEDAARVCTAPEIERIVEPDPELSAGADSKLQRFRYQYQALKGQFA